MGDGVVHVQTTTPGQGCPSRERPIKKRPGPRATGVFCTTGKLRIYQLLGHPSLMGSPQVTLGREDSREEETRSLTSWGGGKHIQK